jgi:hypothetical protein
MRNNKYPIDFDNNWKEVMSAMTPDFLAFFMPKLYFDIDFDHPITFLEQELYDIIQPTHKDKVVDKLVCVRLKNGEEKWILIHTEFQTGAESRFSARMYHYFRLIRAKYDKDVTALAIYTGKQKPRLFDHYKDENYGTSVVYRFNTYRIIKQDEADLLDNPNPFALVVLANLYVLKTSATDTARLTFKEKLYELAHNRGYSDTKIAHLVLFINDLMRLTPSFEYIFKQHISKPVNPKPIMIYHQSTIDVVDIETRNVYGVSIPEARAEARAEVESVQTKLQKSVVLLYTKSQMSVETIAEELGETVLNVRDILTAANIVLPKANKKAKTKI